MKLNASAKSFLAFLGLLVFLLVLTALSSPPLYLGIGTALIMLNKSMKVADMSLPAKMLEFPAKHGSLTAQSLLGKLYYAGLGVPRSLPLAKKWLQKAAEKGDWHSQQSLAYIALIQDSQKDEKFAEAIKWFEKSSAQGASDSEWLLSRIYLSATVPDAGSAFRYCLRAARHGNAQAQGDLGIYYHFGVGCSKDDLLSFNWLKKAASQGLGRAQFALALDLLSGCGCKADEKEALSWLEKAAEHGDYMGQLALAQVYYFQLYGKTDESKGKFWLAKAEKQGSSTAAFLLAELNKPGFAGQNAAGRLNALVKAGQPVNYHAQAVLAGLLFAGMAKKQDEKQALEYYRQAASHGDTDAQYISGYLSYFENGGRLDKNSQALKCLKEAAASGHSQSQDFLGSICFLEDRKKGLQFFQSAAALGNAESQYNLGLAYQRGDAVERDRQAAYKWIAAAAEQGDALAQERLAELIDLNLANRPEQARESLRFHQLSAEQGYLPALDSLSSIYMIGIDTERNLQKSNSYLERVATEGDIPAMLNLSSKCRFGILGASKDEKRALALLKAAAQDGSVEGQLKLGDSYRLGDTVEKNKQEALNWYSKAAAQGSDEAVEKLKKLKKALPGSEAETAP